jgi:hypothetical protein
MNKKLKYKLDDYLKGNCTLSDYYRQFICLNIIFDVKIFVGETRIVLSETKEFTDIADVEFINALRNKHTLLKERLERANHHTLNQIDLICIGKEAAELIREKEIVK